MLSTPALNLLRNNPDLAREVRESIRRQAELEELIRTCNQESYAEGIVHYNVQKCITKHLVLRDHPCTPGFFNCAMFKTAEFELGKIELAKLEAKLETMPPGDPERARTVWAMFHWIARCYDATNVHSSFRSAHGRWDYGTANGPNARVDGALAVVPPDSDEATQALYAAAQTSARAITVPRVDAWAGLDAIGLEARQLLERASAAAGGIASEFIMLPATHADGRGNAWGGKYLDWSMRFAPSWGDTGAGLTGPVYRSPWGRLTRGPAMSDTKAKQELMRLWPGIGASGVQGTRFIRGQRTGFRYRRDPDEDRPTFFMGWDAHEHIAKRLSAHIRSTPFQAFVVSGVYNWVVSTDLLVKLGRLDMRTWDEIVDAFDKNVLSQQGAMGELISTLGVWGKILAVIMYVLAWVILMVSDPAVGGRTCMLMPFIRFPSNVDCRLEELDDASGQADLVTSIRDEFLPKIELHTGFPVGAFRTPPATDLTGPAGPVKKASPLFMVGALGLGALGALAVTR